jgi:hypothetical protein
MAEHLRRRRIERATERWLAVTRCGVDLFGTRKLRVVRRFKQGVY